MPSLRGTGLTMEERTSARTGVLLPATIRAALRWARVMLSPSRGLRESAVIRQHGLEQKEMSMYR